MFDVRLSGDKTFTKKVIAQNVVADKWKVFSNYTLIVLIRSGSEICEKTRQYYEKYKYQLLLIT